MHEFMVVFMVVLLIYYPEPVNLPYGRVPHVFPAV